MFGCGFRTRHPESFRERLEEGRLDLAALAVFAVCPNISTFDIAQFTVNENVESLAGRFASTIVMIFH